MSKLQSLMRMIDEGPVCAPVIYDARDWRGKHQAMDILRERESRSLRELRILVDLAPSLRELSDAALASLLRRRLVGLDGDKLVPVMRGGAEAGLYTVTASAITTGTALKTLLELVSGANTAPTVFQWWCEFNGSAAAAAILVELLRAAAAFTGGTTVTPVLLQPGRKSVQTTCASGIAGSVNTTEGTRGSIIEQHYVPPTSGIVEQYPFAREPEMAVSDRLRISATAAAAVNSAIGFAFSE